MKNKRYFPMFVDLENKPVVVAGGGKIATRRVKTLLKFTRQIHVVAPELTPELTELGELGQIRVSRRACKRDDLAHAYMVLAATSDRKVDDDIYRICREEGIYVNIASDREKCDFHFPGVVIQEEMTIGINASGLDHQKARKVREEIEKCLRDVQ